MWGDVYLYEEEFRVIDSDLFQRQRGVKQLGTSMLVYPSAVQTRFVHALGNLALIDQMLLAAVDNADDETLRAFLEVCGVWLGLPSRSERERDALLDRLRLVMRVAGLCHDLGHLPMGHVVEVAISDHAPLLNEVLGSEVRTFTSFKSKPGGVALHEYFTYRLLGLNAAAGSQLFGRDSELARSVTEVIAATHPHAFDLDVPEVVRALAELVSSNIDSDRAEYLRRDGYVSGAGYGQYDLPRLIASFTLVGRHDGTFVFRPAARALTPVRTFLLERVNAYQHLYYHNLGVLFDALLSEVIRKTLTTSDAKQLTAGVRSPDDTSLRQALSGLTPAAFHYSRFVGERVLDDARLWSYLWDVSAALERVPIEQQNELIRRVRTYLNVLLRRRRHWVWLWKTPDEARKVATPIVDAFIAGLDERRRTRAPREEYLRAMKRALDAATNYEFALGDILILNFIALQFPSQLPAIARRLEAELGPGFFVEIGHRANFKPIKDPSRYELVTHDRTLVPLLEISETSVRAVQALWFENPLLRMYVLTETEVDEGRRRTVQARACARLPAAIRSWVRETPSVSFDPSTGFGDPNP